MLGLKNTARCELFADVGFNLSDIVSVLFPLCVCVCVCVSFPEFHCRNNCVVHLFDIYLASCSTFCEKGGP